jgi:hypothetical protein
MIFGQGEMAARVVDAHTCGDERQNNGLALFRLLIFGGRVVHLILMIIICTSSLVVFHAAAESASRHKAKENTTTWSRRRPAFLCLCLILNFVTWRLSESFPSESSE